MWIKKDDQLINMNFVGSIHLIGDSDPINRYKIFFWSNDGDEIAEFFYKEESDFNEAYNLIHKLLDPHLME